MKALRPALRPGFNTTAIELDDDDGDVLHALFAEMLELEVDDYEDDDDVSRIRSRLKGWNERLQQLREYKLQFGHCRVPKNSLPTSSLGVGFRMSAPTTGCIRKGSQVP